MMRNSHNMSTDMIVQWIVQGGWRSAGMSLLICWFVNTSYDQRVRTLPYPGFGTSELHVPPRSVKPPNEFSNVCVKDRTQEVCYRQKKKKVTNTREQTLSRARQQQSAHAKVSPETVDRTHHGRTVSRRRRQESRSRRRRRVILGPRTAVTDRPRVLSSARHRSTRIR